MRVISGRVTAWLYGDREPEAVARVERGAVVVQALVAGVPTVVLTQPRRVGCCYIPDGRTERPVRSVDGPRASLAFSFGGFEGVVETAPCDELGLRRRALPLREVVSPPSGSLFLGLGWEVLVEAGSRDTSARAAGLVSLYAAAHDDPVLAADAERAKVVIETCTGLVEAPLAPGDILGHGDAGAGRRELCPDADAPDEDVLREADLRTCRRPMKLLLRTSTFEDEVGVLRAGARIEFGGFEKNGTALVRVAQAPAAPIAPAHFALRIDDLVECDDPKKGVR
ncbi:MAG: hypothetical protein HY908_36715 [Myxococcales bacterium]|nr:hypothetical protein [Myxococcales bacterium]